MLPRHELRVVNGHDVAGGVSKGHDNVAWRGAATHAGVRQSCRRLRRNTPCPMTSNVRETDFAYNRPPPAHPSLGSGGAKEQKTCANAKSPTEQEKSATGEAKGAKAGVKSQQKKVAVWRTRPAKLCHGSTVSSRNKLWVSFVANTAVRTRHRLWTIFKDQRSRYHQ